MLRSYASYFAAFVLDRIPKNDAKNIERIVLFGSVAKGEETKASDVDIFMECKKKNNLFEKKIITLLNNFYQSREGLLFKARGIENKINVKIGKLQEWEELYRSIASTGIILYGPYEAKELPTGVTHFILISWDNIPKNRGAFLNKLYGFTSKNKKYPGLLSRYGGQRFGKSCILIPVQHKNEIFQLMQKYQIKAKAIEIFK